MIGMSGRFYTFKNGKLYLHNDQSVDRNTFYGTYTPSQVTMVFNQDPLEAKMFKTMELESDSPWDTVITTDMSSGSMDATYYDLKEGNYFTYIRRNTGATDLDLLSAQGIGALQSIVGTTLNFAFTLPTSISAKTEITIPPNPPVYTYDSVYYYNTGTGTMLYVGDIDTKTSTSLTLVSVVNTPPPGAFILYIKNSQAESFGARGYYMQVELTNDSITDVELFSVSSEVFKSYP
jgi:hypothetical protein